ncbi:MAG: adenylyltransferase/cytidyltransferase family protein [Acholeplasmatales bacterium]|jgi:riboflavin kinase/FMN adenylyltransferase|nr:adenylyltransferase/cytidyltransferase family protein [Acholeplasmatales bacterium]
MKIFKDKINNLYNLIKEDISVIFGNFDGVHLGHKLLFNELINSHEYKSCVITFDKPFSKYNSLYTLDERIEEIKKYNFDYLIIIESDSNFYEMSKENFLSFLDSNQTKKIICGEDISFGKNKSGKLIDLYNANKYEVKVINYYEVDQKKLSSTLLRSLKSSDSSNHLKLILLEGKTFSVEGKVIKGNSIGRTLGFKTANIDIDVKLYDSGVYAGTVNYNKNTYLAVISVGLNETLNLQINKRLEVHILDFDKNIYFETLKINFYYYLRQPKKFLNREELIESINNDIFLTREYFKNLK